MSANSGGIDWGAVIRSPRVLIGGAIVLAIIGCALFVPWLAPNDPEEQNLISALLPPEWVEGGESQFPLGTDSLGRCLLSRLFFGTRVAIYVAVVAAFGAMLLGGVLAQIAGYFGGRVDWAIGRAVDVWMSFPPVVLSLILMVGFGVGVNNVVLAIILVDWTRFCRVLRSEVLVVMRRDYIAAARLVGFTHVQVMVRELLPAIVPLTITLLSLEMGIAVVVETILSFVGLSVEASVPAWGVMIADARNIMYQSPWNLVLPILAVFITVFGFNLLGDGLRRTVDPRLARRAGS